MLFVKEELPLNGVYKIYLENFSDNRGNITNLFDVNQFPDFKIDKLTKSKKNVLRGLHGDSINDKLIYCLKGKIYLAIVNYDKQSEQYLQKFEIEMDEDSNFAVFIPKNFLNGHYCLTEDCLFYYKWSENYVSPENQFSLRWDEPILDIKWPLIKALPVLSERDKKSKFLKEIK